MIALRNCFNLKGPPFPLHILFFPHLFLEEFERMIQFIITRQGHGKKYLVSFFFTIEVFELFRLYLTFLGGSIWKENLILETKHHFMIFAQTKTPKATFSCNYIFESKSAT